METKKILLWWVAYNIVGALVGAAVGFIGGLLGGIVAAISGAPEGFEVLIMIPVIIGALISNFFVFKWAVNKIIAPE